MTNLYDFLRSIYAQLQKQTPGKIIGSPFQVEIKYDSIDWLHQYLKSPDHEIHFKGRQVSIQEDGEPVFAQDYSIKGEPQDIFSLIAEAMMQNGIFAQQVLLAVEFFTDHIPQCQSCRAAVMQATKGLGTYEFKPHAK